MLRARLLLSGGMGGAKNMALDAALLESVGQGAPPCLRFYAWEPPTLSLGYFQRAEEVCDTGFLAARGLGLCRRMSGGGAIFHHHELTLALVLGLDHPALQCGLEESYARLSAPVIELCEALGARLTLRGVGPAVHSANCFAGRAGTDLVQEGAKVFGSAQRRKGRAMLFHGSLLLDLDRELWAGVFRGAPGSGFTSLAQATGRCPLASDLESPLAELFARSLGLTLEPAEPSGQETHRMHELEPSHQA